MFVNELLNDEVFESFGKVFIEKYLRYGFTTLGKVDLQDLILASLSSATGNKLLDGYSDYELANFLKTTDRKIAVSRLNIAQKQFVIIDRVKQVESLIRNVSEKNCKTNSSAGTIELQIDNTVQKREFEAYVRDLGYQIDYKNNRQIIIISNQAFIDTLQKISSVSDLKTAEILSKHINRDIKNEKRIEWLKKFGEKAYEISMQSLFAIIPLFLKSQ
jgi:hypothetical protein